MTTQPRRAQGPRLCTHHQFQCCKAWYGIAGQVDGTRQVNGCLVCCATFYIRLRMLVMQPVATAMQSRTQDFEVHFAYNILLFLAWPMCRCNCHHLTAQRQSRRRHYRPMTCWPHHHHHHSFNCQSHYSCHSCHSFSHQIMAWPTCMSGCRLSTALRQSHHHHHRRKPSSQHHSWRHHQPSSRRRSWHHHHRRQMPTTSSSHH